MFNNKTFSYSEDMALKSVPKLAAALEQHNAIIMLKELYDIGEITKTEYQLVLKEMLRHKGFKLR